ncbi:MAG: hypothetical protein JWN74_1505 [Acidobacteriaceae bacterium]|nr:hypothetical protein [Acidobacteriaceae bacterium]
MVWIANVAYWLLATCVAAGLGAIGFLWERMRRQLNQVLPTEQKVTLYPSLPTMPKSFEELVGQTNELGPFLKVLDQYRKFYPSSSLPKNVALGVVIWILTFIAFLATGIGS